MIHRCTNPDDKDYPNYGGRGITVCDRWRPKEVGYWNFLSDMGKAPGPEYTLDRRDNDGNYEPGNCRWVTRKVQNNNRRSSRRLTHRDRTMTVAEWAEFIGCSRKRLWKRLKLGWPVEKVLREASESRARAA